VQVRFLLGPAGSGKTFRCLAEVGHALAASPEGAPLLLITPKQATYQLERQLLANPAVPGYTRLHILSFERLAYFVFERLGNPPPELLEEGGRLMVLRGLLAKRRDDLKLFRASARLTGFARQLSLVLRELQRNQLTPEALNQLAAEVQNVEGLPYKLQDLATLLLDYLNWLKGHNLRDVDCLLAAATEALKSDDAPRTTHHATLQPLRISHLWVDGFAEWSPQELDLLVALIPRCEQATLAFCLDRVPAQAISWLSGWSMVSRTFEECQKRVEGLPNATVRLEWLGRHPSEGRFANSPVLQHLEQFWAEPQPYPGSLPSELRTPDCGLQTSALRVAMCANPEAEVTLAAREILRHVRAGGRYREVAVLVRTLETYHQPLQRTFSRYEIPFFLDRRESVSHHPLAELTRSALRTVAYQWQRDDWFAALKTGLVRAAEEEIDRLENEALARGWQGAVWQKPISINDQPELNTWLADLHQRVLPPFQRLALALATQQNKPTGPQLAAALREFWKALNVEQQLQEWAAAAISSSAFRVPGSVHSTVWEQMNAWLENLELAFSAEALPLRDWLPILEAGLAGLTVGLIPPALDQVLLGAVDRSRNPEVKLALVLGLNETIFPAPPTATPLLTDADQAELEKHGAVLGATARRQLGRERYYAYIACTRPRERLVLTCAQHDADGAPLNPSPFLSRVRQLFPSLKVETVPKALDWRESEHPHELIVPLLKVSSQRSEVRGQSSVMAEEASLATNLAPRATSPATHHPLPISDWETLASLPALASIIERLRHFHNPPAEEALAPELAARLYSPILRTSVSRMEEFAACPFKFFVHSGLRAEERKRFELDPKEQGSFQHDVLACFHEQLRSEQKRWRDVTPPEARARIARIAQGLMASYRDGLLQASEQSRFMARVLTESLQDFVETLVGWMRQQYQFDPVAVELAFGADESAPAWEIDIDQGHKFALHGRIDRVDLYRRPGDDEALCVVVDYKSSQKQLDPVLMAHGLELQLLTYLNVLRHWPRPRETFGASRLIPAGVFYVNLRGKYDRAPNRLSALADPQQARKLAYRHTGRFDTRALRQLDARTDAREGDQFSYRLKNNGEVYKTSREALATPAFEGLLDSVAANLRTMGREIFSGVAKVAPYRKGSITACDQCDYRSICRLDPWTHRYRVLRKIEEETE
jgi:ATP-dependent helicase/nuclease subunit B